MPTFVRDLRHCPLRQVPPLSQNRPSDQAVLWLLRRIIMGPPVLEVEVKDVERENFRLWWVCTIQGGIMWRDKEVVATQTTVSNPPVTSPTKPVPSSWKDTRTSIDLVRHLTTLSDRTRSRLSASLEV